jgi:hypothetical protein
VELVESAKLALEELIEVTGRAAIVAVLELSAVQVAGAPHRDRRGGRDRLAWRQQGQVRLAQRKPRVQRIRLRRKVGASRKFWSPLPYVLDQNDLFAHGRHRKADGVEEGLFERRASEGAQREEHGRQPDRNNDQPSHQRPVLICSGVA